MLTIFDKTITIIGLGNIGKILIQQLLKNKIPPVYISVIDKDLDHQNLIAKQYNVQSLQLENINQQNSSMVLIATPPNVVLSTVKQLVPQLKSGQIVVSFAAAISLERLEEALPEGVSAARIMPNAPSILGQGMNPVCFGAGLDSEMQVVVMELLSFLGETLQVSDEQMNWCVGLSGAAMRSLLPALEGMTAAGTEAGLDPENARRVAAQTMIGTAALALNSNLEYDELKKLTPMQTVDDENVRKIFLKAAREAKTKVDDYQKKLESENIS